LAFTLLVKGPNRAIARFAWGAVLIACMGLSIELIFYNQPFMAAKLLRYYWFRLTDFAAPMAVAILATTAISIGLQQRRRWATPLLAASLLLAGGYVSTVAITRIHNPVPLADARLAIYPAWVEVCDWIAANTPPDALFVTPRLNQSFKWRAGRPEVVNRKDIPQDAHNMIEWNRRLKDIYNTKIEGAEVTLDSIGARGTDEVRGLATKYHANYVLTDRGQLLALPIVFRNEEYVVYRIEDRNTGNRR
jgi:uncharacterized protein DUF6798